MICLCYKKELKNNIDLPITLSMGKKYQANIDTMMLTIKNCDKIIFSGESIDFIERVL